MKARWIIVALLVVLALGGLAYVYQDSVDKEAILEYGKSVPAGGLVAAFLVLPLLGFPVSILLVLVGLRFGLGWGMVVTAAGTYFHHAVAYGLCQGRFGERVREFAERRGYRLPDVKSGNAVWLTILFTSIHGPPYTLKLYLLALTRIPFWIFGLVGGTVYVLFALIPVGAAAAAVHVDVTWIYIAVAVISGGALLGKWWRGKRCRSQDAG